MCFSDELGRPLVLVDQSAEAEYGYCASYSRYFWGLRLHMLATLHGIPVGFALTGAKADERQVKNYFGTDFEATLADAGLTLPCPA